LNKKKKEIKDKRIKRIRIKGKNGLGKIASRTGTTRLLQRHPQVTFLASLALIAPRCLDIP
jgi:hypothetical protein